MAAIKQLYDEYAAKWLKPGVTIWVFSDPHFNDLESKVFRGESYPGDDALVKRINSKVGKHDVIIFLGDIGDLEYVKKIKGYKVLIMGNHDQGITNYKREYETYHLEKVILKNYTCYGPGQFEDSYEYKKVVDSFDNHLFDEVYGGPLFVGPKLLLSHEPIYYPYAYNIHGHVHSLEAKNDDNHFNACAEHIDYTPVRLSDIIAKAHLSKIPDIHRATIDNATERKMKKISGKGNL